MFNKSIADALGIETENVIGMVIFYHPNYQKQTISEINRTPELPFSKALDIYAETPNPASQLLQWKTDDEKEKVLTQHALNIKNPEWLENLFDMI